MALTDEQMHQATLFAVALDRMCKAMKVDEPVTLTAEENATMVAMILVLA